jgi:hypothetical protein
MARQSISVNPSLKEFEAYMDFSGGMNNETSNERLNDNEFTQMQNIDLNTRGSVKKRTGRDLLTTAGLPLINAQGFFFFYRKNQTLENPDIVFAIDGKLYVKKMNNLNNSATIINITGMLNGFDKNIIVEAVQYYDKLYVATGTNIVVVSVDEQNGQYSASVITPYEPNSNELKYIGTNALLEFGMTNTNNSSFNNVNQFSVKGFLFTEYGTNKTLINAQTKERFNIKTYLIENTALSYLKKYRFYYKKPTFEGKETRTYLVVPPPIPPATYDPDDEIVAVNNGALIKITDGSSYAPKTNGMEVYDKNGNALLSGVGFEEYDSTTVILRVPAVAGDKFTIKYIPDWYSENSKFGSFAQTSLSSNEVVFRPLEVGYYDFKMVVDFEVNNQVEHTSEYIYQGLQVKAFKEEGDILEQIVAGAKKCNRIRLYWDRLMLFGDPDEPTQIYFSDINNPAYFPQVNCLRFDTGKQEPITSVVRLNDYLVVFSKTLIHILTGKTKDEFSVNLINDSIGCIAPRSAVLTGNVITFLSEEGVFQLRPSTFKLDQLNVQRVDSKIKGEIKKVTNACALNFDSQYWLCYPDDKVIYRYYYEKGVWVKDNSIKLNFVQFLQEGNNVFNLSADVKLYKNNSSVYTDAEEKYDMVVESKYFDLSKAFNFKKLKRLYILGKGYDNYDAEFKVKVFADSAIVLDPEVGYAHIVEHQGREYSEWTTSTTPNIEFHQASILGDWVLGEDILGGEELSVQKSRIRGKCRRVKLVFVNSQDKEVELFGFGLEFKLKKP